GRASLEHRQQHDRKLRRSRHAHERDRAPYQAARNQVPRERVRPPIELAIAQRSLAVRYGVAVWPGRGPQLDFPVDGLVCHISPLNTHSYGPRRPTGPTSANARPFCPDRRTGRPALAERSGYRGHTSFAMVSLVAITSEQILTLPGSGVRA